MVSFNQLLLVAPAAVGLAAAQYGGPAPAAPSSSAAPAPSAAAASSGTSSSSGAIQTISVGANNQLAYSPNSLVAAVGSQVEFVFMSSLTHSATGTTFDKPCVADPSSFFSGGFPMSNSADNSFIITINSTDPIWFFCSVPQHCQAGMVGVINPPSNMSESLDAFTTAAKATSQTTPGSTIQGGVVGPMKAASSGTSASGSSAASGSSSASPAATSAKTSGAADVNGRFAFVGAVGALAAGWVVSLLM